MIRYLKIKYGKENNSKDCYWFLEIDDIKEDVIREIKADLNNNILSKAPTTKNNYGVFTDNLKIVISPQKPHTKESIVFDLNENNIEEISKEEFEEKWITINN